MAAEDAGEEQVPANDHSIRGSTERDRASVSASLIPSIALTWERE